jgi:uncharacterized protein DUF955
MKFWKDKSVLKFAGNSDPVEAVLARAQSVVFDAIEKGWNGPPFDPFELASIRKVSITPREDVPDARLISRGGQPVVEYNPLRPASRIRFSVAHELAHSLFPNYAERIRNRSFGEAEWQLEMLCNLAAAEFLMPTGSFAEFEDPNIEIDLLMELRSRYQVSTEAMLLRVLRLGLPSLLVFAASTRDGETYVFDYALEAAGPIPALYGRTLRRESLVKNCSAIGFTDKGPDKWPTGVGSVYVECVGIPPYPNSVFPRVVGFAKREQGKTADVPRLKEVRGNALKPHPGGPRLLAHVVNNEARSWGKGFGKQVGTEYPEVARRFRLEMEQRRLDLGDIFATEVNDSLTIVQLVAQKGYGELDKLRLRYGALQTCLRSLRTMAIDRLASVHMPPIGVGYGGGAWGLIRELIDQELCRHGVEVTVYKRDETAAPLAKQQSLF